MRILIVGGTWAETIEEMKSSSIIYKIEEKFKEKSHYVNVYNGGWINDLKNLADYNRCKYYDLILWMPNVSNEEEKIYPKKCKGTVLICSKVIGNNNRDKGDAVARIFKMNANAVLAIDKSDKEWNFILLDALANQWVASNNYLNIIDKILDLCDWTSQYFRINS